MIFIHIATPLICLSTLFFVTSLIQASRALDRIRLKQAFAHNTGYRFFYRIVNKLFPERTWEGLFYLLSLTQYLLRILLTVTMFYYIYRSLPSFFGSSVWCSLLLVLVVGSSFEFLVRSFAYNYPLALLRVVTPPAVFLLLLLLPLTLFLLKGHTYLTRRHTFPDDQSKLKGKWKEKILELAQESELSETLDPADRRLITSVASFRDRIVRKIMVPRVDIFALSVDQTVHEAVRKCLSEGYSRIPVYDESLDTVRGVLLAKDVIEHYFRCLENGNMSPMNTPLEKLLKPVLYAPETKKIFHLLQEMRNRQMHLAIVVDEYGGTEGVVTIEDILEELVGEIADEHDIIEEETLYKVAPEGGWIVDPKMTVTDVEKELGITIPQSSEYDTLGGFVFHRAAAIPGKGWKMHGEGFDLEVLSSSERNIEKIILMPSTDK
ncbi:MAG: hemolysin family protein [Simkaniaceae bacterium]|nr:hemolysin family protein [Simkaniaceae bacterium]